MKHKTLINKIINFKNELFFYCKSLSLRLSAYNTLRIFQNPILTTLVFIPICFLLFFFIHNAVKFNV